jgi:hypothetical protein
MTNDDAEVPRLRSLVFDCADPRRLASFYADLFGVEVFESDPEWSEVHLPGSPMKLAFQRVRDYTIPDWPNGQPQQVHLDLTVTDLEAASHRAVALGARVLGRHVFEPDCVFQVHADPSGHPFCLCTDREGSA